VRDISISPWSSDVGFGTEEGKPQCIDSQMPFDPIRLLCSDKTPWMQYYITGSYAQSQSLSGLSTGFWLVAHLAVEFT